MRRPRASTVIALTALFVALGGPAQAKRLIDGHDIRKGTVRSAQIKDGSLGLRDLSPATVRALRLTADGSIAEGKLADAAVTAPKLGAGAVTGAKLAAGSVGSVAVADGSLTTADVARFAGRFSIQVPAIGPVSCWAGQPQGLAPEQAGADLSSSLVVVTPDYQPDRRSLTVTPWVSDRQHFAVTICNLGLLPYDGGIVPFRYAVLQVA